MTAHEHMHMCQQAHVLTHARQRCTCASAAHEHMHTCRHAHVASTACEQTRVFKQGHHECLGSL
eukprot:1158455-Pelagomonas_calceolata.AAC.6